MSLYFHLHEGHKGHDCSDTNGKDRTVVEGRLKANLDFWEGIGASSYILSVLRDDYPILLTSEPPPIFQRNNRSANLYKNIVTEAVLEILATNKVNQVPFPPHIVCQRQGYIKTSYPRPETRKFASNLTIGGSWKTSSIPGDTCSSLILNKGTITYTNPSRNTSDFHELSMEPRGTSFSWYIHSVLLQPGTYLPKLSGGW